MKRIKELKNPEKIPVVASPRALPDLVDQVHPNLQLHPRPSLDGNYQVGEALGAGSSAEVPIATDKNTGKQVAIKTFKKAGLNEVIEARIRKEYALMKHLTHKNLVTLIDVVENPEEIIIIMEYASAGDLHTHLSHQPDWRLDENAARNIFKQIAKGVRHLHRCGFVHRDIKLENILLDGPTEKPRALLADLGYGTIWRTNEVTNTPCGSLYFAAPEIVSAEPYIGPEIDIWSLGIVLYAICSGCLPFLHHNERKTAKLIREGRYEVFDFWSKHLKQLIAGMLRVEQSKRMTIDEVLHHKWTKPRRRSQGLSIFTKKKEKKNDKP